MGFVGKEVTRVLWGVGELSKCSWLEKKISCEPGLGRQDKKAQGVTPGGGRLTRFCGGQALREVVCMCDDLHVDLGYL